MLHILLLILKCAGIILAVILGILVLLICIVLFASIRYETDVICKGSVDSLKAKAQAVWLFHLIRADIYYKERKLKWRVRIAWKKITGGESFGDVVEEKVSEEAKKNEEKRENSEEVKETYESQEQKEPEEAKETYESQEKKEPEEVKPEEAEPEEDESEKTNGSEKNQTGKRIAEALETGEEKRLWEDEKADEQAVEKRTYESEELREKKNDSGGKIRRKAQRLYEKGKKSCQKINELYQKIQELLEKKEKLTDFITDEIHIGAFLKLKKEAFRLLKKLKPKELQMKVRFGFEDPLRTGQILAFLSILYPFSEDHMTIIPDFENRVLKGKIHVKGNIRVCHFVMCAGRLFLCKKIRSTYKDIRKFEL